MFLRNYFFLSKNVSNFKMVDVQPTFNQATPDYTGTPTGACGPRGKYKKKKKSRRLKFVNIKFSVSIKNRSGIFAAAKLYVSFQTSSKRLTGPSILMLHLNLTQDALW